MTGWVGTGESPRIFSWPATHLGFLQNVCIFVRMSINDVIKGLKEIAIQALPEGGQAILFGSRARGDARADSDWDVLILIRGGRISAEDFDRFAYPFVDYGWSIGEQVHPLIYTYDEWRQRSISPFYKEVQAEGISLCH